MMQPKKQVGYIYKITSPTKRVYIGQTVNLKDRKKKYRGAICKGQIRIYRSILKYGWAKHKFEVVTECDVSELNKWERYYQDLYSSMGPKGLNCKLTGYGERSIIHSPETRLKMSIAHKKKIFTEEHRAKMTQGLINKGKTAEQIEQIKSLALARIGTRHRQETKDKISQTKKGTNAWNKGISRTEAEKRKMSENRVGKFAGDNNKNCTILLNLETGIYYYGYEQAADSTGRYSRHHINNMILGKYPNKLSFIKV